MSNSPNLGSAMPIRIIEGLQANRDKQILHESRSDAKRLRKYRKREERKEYLVSKEGREFVNRLENQVVKYLEEAFAEQAAMHEGSQVRWYRALRKHIPDADLQELARASLSVMAQSTKECKNWHKAVHHLMAILNDIVWIAQLEEELGEKFETVRRRVFDNPSDNKRMRARMALAKATALDQRPIADEDDAAAIAYFLLGAVCESTGMFEREYETGVPIKRSDRKGGKGPQTDVTCSYTDEGRKYRGDLLAELESKVYKYRFMRVQPLDWVSAHDGGDLTHKNVLLTGYPAWRNKEFDKAPVQEIMDCVNTLQAVEWSIHEGFFQFMQEAWKRGDTFLFPEEQPAELLKKLPYPQHLQDKLLLEDIGQDVEWTAEEENELDHIRVHNKLASKAKQKSVTAHNLAISTRREARSAYALDKFYFMWQVDWRGRKSPLTASLDPQGTGFDKALLQFKDGKPLNAAGLRRLKLTIADLAGCKGSVEEMLSWFDDNEVNILEAAADPHNKFSWWRVGDDGRQRKPKDALPLLARCFDYFDYMLDPEGFIFKAPVFIDAVNSGNQHWAAATKDHIVAPMVSMTPDEYKGDMYQVLVNTTIDLMEQDAKAANPEVRENAEWLLHIFRPLLDRAFLKKGGMCYNYTQGSWSRSEDLVDMMDLADENLAARIGTTEVFDKRRARKRPEHRIEAYQRAANALEKYQLKALEATNNYAVGARKALVAVANIMGKHNLTMTWTAPSGLKVHQVYYGRKSVQGGVLRWGKAKIEPSKVIHLMDRQRTGKHTAGICPQFIHAMDAAHIDGVVNTWASRGHKNIVTIHDSVGCHPNDLDELASIARSEFRKIYEGHDRLQEFIDEQAENVKGTPAEKEFNEKVDDIRAMITYGDYDIKDVDQSYWFFS